MKLLSRVQLFATPRPARLLHPWDFPGKNTGVGCHFLLQRTFPTQGLNLGLSVCRQTLLPSEPPGKYFRVREVMLEKKQFQAIFSFEFNMGHKAMETTRNIQQCIWPRNCYWTYTAVVVQEILQRRREPWGRGAWWLATGSWQWPAERVIKADPLKTTEKLPKNSTLALLWSIQH